LGFRWSNLLARWKLVFSFTLLLILLLPLSSSAETLKERKAEAVRLKIQIIENQKALDRATAAYERAGFRLEAIQASIRRNEQELVKTRRALTKAQTILNSRLTNIYKYGESSFVEVLLGAKNFQDFLVRLDLLTLIAQRDSEKVAEVIALKKKLENQEKKLAQDKKRQQILVKKALANKRSIESRLRRQQRLLSQLQKRIKILSSLSSVRKLARRVVTVSRGKSRILSLRGFVFPVAGPHSFSDTWGAARSGGRHHKGTDIFALRGTPVVAVVSGTIFNVHPYERGLGGITLWLRGNDGNSYYYAHLSAIASGIGNGSQVQAGQVIGYVGNTGNARGSSPHLHFEIHPGGGGAINPYPTLRAVD
jgi:murein DD-endopeptidase MepM/ murein hydrolase activator NlpD